MLDPNNIDFKELGFHAGLEIHHQLKSKRKLFCHCPAELSLDLQRNPSYTFQRRFRAVMGEMGDFDPGMLVEVEKGYLVTYHADSEHVCTYEMDETPPFEPDEEAIAIGYHLACLFNCRSPVEEIVVNRKQYLDGSITTGFQRTFIVARDGFVELRSGKKVPISNILIEEDAARKITTKDRGRSVYYNLDRLGIPLTEIITDHKAIDTPEELLETARMIGLNMRTTGLVRRGIGVVRQDVNISITGGSRAEIKGLQDLSMLVQLCATEVCRQQALIDIKTELENSSLEKEEFTHTYIDISHLFTDLKHGESAFVVRLPSFEEILLTEVQPGKDFGFEIFEKCSLITGIQNNELFHSGEIRAEAIRRKHHSRQLFIDERKDVRIRNVLQLEQGDAYIAVRGPTNRVFHALKKTVERCKQAFDGVPQETRRALPNGNNEFLRVIHGKERLYPDTDTPPMPYPHEKLEEIRKQIKPRPLELFRKYEPMNLTFEQLTHLIRAERIQLFDQLVAKEKLPVALVYHVLFELTRRLRREGCDIAHLSDDILAEAIKVVSEKGLSRSILPSLLGEMSTAENPEEQLKILTKASKDKLSIEEIRSLVSVTIDRMTINGKKPGMRAVIGSIMKEYNRRLDGKMLAIIVEELL